MKKIAHKDVYNGFTSFSEIINWLKQDYENRSVRYKNGDKNYELGVFLGYNKETKKYDTLGLNIDTFQFVNKDEEEIYSLEEYFDKNDQPLDEKFAENYDLSKFIGEEYVEEK